MHRKKRLMKRSTSKRKFCLLASVGLLCLLASGQVAANNVEDVRYQQALAFAKNKDYENSTKLFKELISQYPQNITYLSDYIQILATAGKDDAVLALAEKVPVDQVRAYVLEAIARSTRNLKKFKQSEYFYQTTINRFPDRLDAYIGLAFVLVDENRSKDALNIILPLEKKYPANTEILFAAGYVYEMGQPNDLFSALKYYEKVMAINAKHEYAIKRRIFVVSKLGAPSLAHSMAQKYPDGFFSADEMARIRWDKAAYWIRWGEAGNTVDETKRFDDTDRAVKELTQNIDYAKSKGLDKDWITNAHLDLIIALRDRFYMREVVTEAEKLLAENVNLSTDAMVALGDAYLYLEEPESAKQWYFEALKNAPQSFPLRSSIFYAHLEANDYDDSTEVIEKLASEQALRQIREYKGNDSEKPIVVTDENPNKTAAEATLAMSKAYLDDLGTAEEKIKFLSDSAPHNQNLRANLASVYYWRGWPRRAQEEYEIGLNAEPKNIGLGIDLARNQLDLKEYRLAEKQVTGIYQLYPENKHAQKQYKLWEIHNDPELHVEVNGSETSGAQQQGSRGFEIESYLYSSPIDYNFRFFVHQRWTKANFVFEGLGQTQHEGIGVEYTRPDLKLTAEVHHNNYATRTNRIGFSAAGNYDFDDQWSVNALFETVSADTPLRALKNNIYAQSISVGGKFRQHESREFSLNGSYLDFSDGNQRYTLSNSYFERWYSGPVYKLGVYTNLFYTQNSLQDVPYFSPKRNAMVSVTFDNDLLTYQNYDTSWHQNLAFTVGQSWQQSFGGNTIYSVAYQHRWKACNRLELVYGSSYGAHYYDGLKAMDWQYFMMLNWRF